MSTPVFASDAVVTSPEYVVVTDKPGGSAIGVAKVHSNGTADIILFPECPKHDKPTKITMSFGFDFPIEVRR